MTGSRFTLDPAVIGGLTGAEQFILVGDAGKHRLWLSSRGSVIPWTQGKLTQEILCQLALDPDDGGSSASVIHDI